MAGYQTWDEQLPLELEAIKPIFGGLFKDSDDRIIPWSGTDLDSNVNCFTWNFKFSTWICKNDTFYPTAS